MTEEHIPVPSDHAPRKETYFNQENEVTIQEANSPTAWITMNAENTMQVKQ